MRSEHLTDNHKKLVFIAGAPGVGKTTLCKQLFSNMEGCAWLDSDWCWMVNPWHAKSEKQKKDVETIFGQLLRGYLTDTATEIVLFSWVFHHPSMFELITRHLQDLHYELIKIALICEREPHIERMKKDGRRLAQAENPDSMEAYYMLDAHVLDVTAISPEEAARNAMNIIFMEDCL